MGLSRPGQTSPDGVVSAGNTTTTALGADEVFTGSWVECANFSTLAVKAIAAPAGGQLTIEFSVDGSTAYNSVNIGSDDGTFRLNSLGLVDPYVRVKFTNGSTPQTSFTLVTRLQVAPTLYRNRAGATLNDTTDVLPVRVVTDELLDEASGRQTDRLVERVAGANPSVGAGTEEDLWVAGGLYSGWLQAASAVRIKAGGDAADTVAGAGARKILISGLDENWQIASEVVDTAGSSASAATTTTFIRVSEAYVTDCGTFGGSNVGAIDIETTAGTLVARIGQTSASSATGLGRTQLAMYSIPDGYTGYIRRLSVTVQGTKAADVYLWCRPDGDTTAAPHTGRQLIKPLLGLSGDKESEFSTYPGPFPARTDIWASAVGPSGGAAVSAEFDVVLVAV